MYYKKHLFGSIIALILILSGASCRKSEKAIYIEARDKAINELWILLDSATNSPEIEKSVSLGFTLGCSEEEFFSHCREVVKKYGGFVKEPTESKEQGYYQKAVILSGFGVKDSISVSCFTAGTDTVREISFKVPLFSYVQEISLGNDVDILQLAKLEEGNDYKIDTLIAYLDSTLSNYRSIEFQTANEKPKSKYSSYHKFWIKDNMVVHLKLYPDYVSINFESAPTGSIWLTKELIEAQVQSEEERDQKERSHKPVVQNSKWDSSVYQVKEYLKKNLKDPDSYESIDWYSVIENVDGTYSVRHTFRARNSFGGMNIEDWMFDLDQEGNVIAATPL